MLNKREDRRFGIIIRIVELRFKFIGITNRKKTNRKKAKRKKAKRKKTERKKVSSEGLMKLYFTNYLKIWFRKYIVYN